MQRVLFLAAMASLVALFVYMLAREPSLASPLVGGPAPELTVPLYAADSTVTLEGLAGRPAVVNFWASWCLSCRDEARVLEAGWRRYGPEVAFVGVAVDDEAAAARGFIQRYGKTYLLGPDRDGSIALNYGLYGVPETFFLGADGRILSKHTGPLTEADLERGIERARSGVASGVTGERTDVERLP